MIYPLSQQINASIIQPINETVGKSSMPMRANIVPTLRQTVHGLEPVENVKNSKKHEANRTHITINHPRFAPSAISAEEYFIARNSLAPIYNHNMAATREARTSNIHNETPRFREQLDVLA